MHLVRVFRTWEESGLDEKSVNAVFFNFGGKGLALVVAAVEGKLALLPNETLDGRFAE